ncbi:MAG: hypothetical protein EOP89_05365 [Lysobacteraceae bacterium]|nr:MAG: hypothetical protein EOP89_05365 [Xanthomonadaceae bacterium]
MPCFHLNLIGDDVVRDDEGHDLPDLSAAIDRAVMSAREIVADRIVAGEVARLGDRIEIAGADGRVMHVVVFADVVRFAD